MYKRLFKRLSKRISTPLRRLILSPGGQRLMTSLFDWLASGQRGRRILSQCFRGYRWYYLMLARTQRRQGDDHGAFHTLMMGQRCPVDDYRIHTKLSEIYRDNGDVFSAHTHLKIASLLNPGYSTIRLLTFETDHELRECGSNTMANILEFQFQLIHRHLPMINRISIFYPEHRDNLNEFRRGLEGNLRDGSLPIPKNLSKAVDMAIANRWLDLALDLSKNKASALSPVARQLLARLEADLGKHVLMLQLAWQNEMADVLTGLIGGRIVPVEESDANSNRIVELFIPTPFFASPEQEKPTYETIRRMFIQVIEFLLENDDLIIIPRFQLYWKHCVPKTRHSRVISYHTSSSLNPRRLHIQESPLAGRCSFDEAGFAGYASIADDHSEIIRATSSVSEDQLRRNQSEMYDRYVTANVSKYHQPSGNEPIGEPYVFVALQIPTDIVSRLAWMTGIELLRNVVEFYRGTKIRVVVKRHPFCGSMSVQKCLDVMEAAGDIIRTNNSIHSLIADARIVLTVNSGVGLEALIHGKPVVVSGRCDYSYAALSVKNPEELREALAAEIAADDHKIRELLYFYVHRFTFSSSDTPLIRARLENWLNGSEVPA